MQEQVVVAQAHKLEFQQELDLAEVELVDKDVLPHQMDLQEQLTLAVVEVEVVVVLVLVLVEMVVQV